MTRADDGAVLRRGIRTYKPRRSRMTARQAHALTHHGRWLLNATEEPLDLPSIFGRPVVLEIGSGTGTATAQMAAAQPDVGILAIDIHTPGIGNLLDLIDRGGLENVRVMEADALTVMRHQISPGSLVGVRSFFPDPWPKARHHKRRLAQQPVMDLVRDRLQPGGYWHFATDWEEYAEFIEAAFAVDDAWTGGPIPRPDSRPVTHYEARALRAGRHITDLLFHGRITP